MKSTVIIRADSSSTIGTGHIMRDLVLAEREFSDARVIFAVRDLPGNINRRIEEAGYEVVLLESEEIREVADLVIREKADTIVIDHYGIGYDEEKSLKVMTGAKIFILDDTYERHYCDVLLNHNVYAEATKYRGLVPGHCEIWCGSEYTLLRREFLEAKKNRASQKVLEGKEKKVFLAMGGADHSQVNIPILEVLKRWDNLKVDIVTTSANSGLNRLKDYVRRYPNFRLHINTDRIAELMISADFAVVSPSVVLNELFFLDVPFVAIMTADNQKEMYNYLKRKKFLILKRFEIERFKKSIEQIKILIESNKRKEYEVI